MKTGKGKNLKDIVEPLGSIGIEHYNEGIEVDHCEEGKIRKLDLIAFKYDESPELGKRIADECDKSGKLRKTIEDLEDEIKDKDIIAALIYRLDDIYKKYWLK